MSWGGCLFTPITKRMNDTFTMEMIFDFMCEVSLCVEFNTWKNSDFSPLPPNPPGPKTLPLSHKCMYTKFTEQKMEGTKTTTLLGPAAARPRDGHKKLSVQRYVLATTAALVWRPPPPTALPQRLRHEPCEPCASARSVSTCSLAPLPVMPTKVFADIRIAEPPPLRVLLPPLPPMPRWVRLPLLERERPFRFEFGPALPDLPALPPVLPLLPPRDAAFFFVAAATSNDLANGASLPAASPPPSWAGDPTTVGVRGRWRCRSADLDRRWAACL